MDTAIDYRTALTNCFQWYSLSAQIERIHGRPRILVVATLKPRAPVNFDAFPNAQYARFDLTSYISCVLGSLSWDKTGTATHSVLTGASITENGRQRNLTIRINNAPSINAIDLASYLQIVQHYDNHTRQFYLRLGIQSHPSVAPQRSIVLCFDGTSNSFSNQNTNVVKLVELLKKDDPTQQMVYYQPGVGTYSHPGITTPLMSKLAKTADLGLAWYIYQHVIDGYQYLMETYKEGDQISIFGFSRGAYTARALAGMLHAVGLLPRHNKEQVPFAYQVYTGELSRRQSLATPLPGPDGPIKYVTGALDIDSEETGVHGAGQSEDPDQVDPKCFKMVFCIPVEIKFLGVWDTVGSVGAFLRTTLPWVEYNPSVKHFRQALALDENRGSFIPSLWDHTRTVPPQTAIEVWFKGGHSDVGGGAPLTDMLRNVAPLMMDHVQVGGQNSQEGLQWAIPDRLPDMSNISLRWMVDQCYDRGVFFDPYSMNCYRKAAILEQRNAYDDEDVLRDRRALLNFYDALKAPYKGTDESVGWWLLEALPLPKIDQRSNDRSRPATKYWYHATRPNLGNSRFVNNVDEHGNALPHIRLHYSASIGNYTPYTPAAEFASGTNHLHIEDTPTYGPEDLMRLCGRRRV